MLDYNFHLPTERLIISYLNPSNPLHVSFVYDRYNTRASLDANRRFPNLIHDHDAAKAKIEKEDQMMQSKGYGQYLVSISPQQNPSEDLPFSKAIDGHELIGCVSMRHGRLPSAPMYPDVGYAFEEKAQGKGYATEAAKALIKYYQRELGQDIFLAYCDPENEKSKRVLQRLGFKEHGVKDIHVMGDGVLHQGLVWSLGLEGEL